MFLSFVIHTPPLPLCRQLIDTNISQWVPYRNPATLSVSSGAVFQHCLGSKQGQVYHMCSIQRLQSTVCYWCHYFSSIESKGQKYSKLYFCYSKSRSNIEVSISKRGKQNWNPPKIIQTPNRINRPSFLKWGTSKSAHWVNIQLFEQKLDCSQELRIPGIQGPYSTAKTRFQFRIPEGSWFWKLVLHAKLLWCQEINLFLSISQLEIELKNK